MLDVGLHLNHFPVRSYCHTAPQSASMCSGLILQINNFLFCTHYIDTQLLKNKFYHIPIDISTGCCI